MAQEVITAKNSKPTAKKKPRGRGFVKGQSGNPKGRPRTGTSWAELIRARPITEKADVIRTGFEQARAGNVAWAEFLVKHSGEVTTQGLVRELIVREYEGIDLSALD